MEDEEGRWHNGRNGARQSRRNNAANGMGFYMPGRADAEAASMPRAVRYNIT
jgi:hypothetical protein